MPQGSVLLQIYNIAEYYYHIFKTVERFFLYNKLVGFLPI